MSPLTNNWKFKRTEHRCRSNADDPIVLSNENMMIISRLWNWLKFKIKLRRIWRYQRGNQKLYIEEEQTTQWPQDTKGAIRNCISKKNRKHNGQKKKYKWINNNLQYIHLELKIEYYMNPTKNRYYEQSDWLKKVIAHIYHIVKYSWHGGHSDVTCNGVSSDLQSRDMSVKGSK